MGKKKPLTREEEREFAEKIFGNPYMMVQPEGQYQKFVIQRHCRGLWSFEDQERLKAIFSQLKEGKLPSRKDVEKLDLIKPLAEEEREKLLKLLEQEVPEEDLDPLFQEEMMLALEAEDLPGFYDRLWHLSDAEYMIQPLQKWQKELQRADDERKDITKVVDKYLETKAPALEDLDIEKVYNRGNAHSDIRMEHVSKKYLIGITNTSPRLVFQSLDTGELIFPLRDKLLENKPLDKMPCTRKARQPLPWLTLVTKKKPVFEALPGTAGATLETTGRFLYMAEGEYLSGVNKDDYHEFWFFFESPHEELSGRWGFQKLAGRYEYEKVPAEWWMMNKVYLHPEGYLLTHPDRGEVERKAKREGLTRMIYNPQTVKMLLEDPRAKGWFKGIEPEFIERVLEEYEKRGAEWKRSTKG